MQLNLIDLRVGAHGAQLLAKRHQPVFRAHAVHLEAKEAREILGHLICGVGIEHDQRLNRVERMVEKVRADLRQEHVGAVVFQLLLKRRDAILRGFLLHAADGAGAHHRGCDGEA
ncbi:hypothetical protein SDC9_129325 [bioreactor metagenome]|uniref:Uncharacterized protein n=1 Tax=bioreactor metagenome TaxID=1076179 RepID=A0A645CZ63_9ZZZZ